MRVVVVGAGFAGLACADRLVDLGHDVVVFEARDRVGGRVWSQPLIADDPDTLVERGAEFVLDGYAALRDVARRLGLSLADTGMSYYVREPRGGAPTTPDAIAVAGRQLAEAARNVPVSTSLRDLASRLSGDRAALDACVARMSLSCAYPPELLSAWAALEASAQTEWKPSHRVAGGNQLIATGLAARLGARLHPATPVTAVTSHAEQVVVHGAGGEVTGDAVVVAVPAAVIDSIVFEPALPAAKTCAFGRLGQGQAAKLHLPLTKPAPYSAVIDVSRGLWCWTAAGVGGETQPILHSFASSAPVLDALDVARGPSTWVAALEELRPELDLQPSGALLTTWRDDPWTQMAYSALSTHTQDSDADLLAGPVGRVHFAGEHTAGPWAGLMEGALRSGLRAAAELDAQA
jgi:monoamine oxidase